MLLAALLLVTGPCGIAQVEADPEGVRITFTYPRTAQVWARQAEPRPIEIDTAPILLRVGETLEFHHENDGCTLTATVIDGQPGIEQTSWVGYPGQMPFRETSFVSAQRR